MKENIGRDIFWKKCIVRKSPIEILQYNICSHFQSMYGKTLKEDLDLEIISPFIFCERSSEFKGPYTDGKKIYIHKGYINFLWAFIYGYWVEFEELFMKSELEKIYDKNIVMRARDLRRYSEKKMCSQWPLNLPRPDGIGSSPKEKYYVYRVNGIFLDTLAILLFHEVGHIKFKHHGIISKLQNVDRIQCENDCDVYAVETVLNGAGVSESNLFKAKSIAIFFAFSSMFFSISSPIYLTQRTHPDLDVRLANMLAKLNIRGQELSYYIYRVADKIVRRFYYLNRTIYQAGFVNFKNKTVNTSKELFEDDIDILKPFIVYSSKSECAYCGGYVLLQGRRYILKCMDPIDGAQYGDVYVEYYHSLFLVGLDLTCNGDVLYSYECKICNTVRQ